MKLPADAKVAIAFLVAYVLDLVKIAGRKFAKYSAIFDPSLVVNEQDVVEYETIVQTHLFDRVGASVRDALGKVGGLAERLRSMSTFCFDILLDWFRYWDIHQIR